MPPSSFFLLSISYLLLLLLVLLPYTIFCLNQEGLDLLEAKSILSDPSRVLLGWNPAHDTPCNWTGITCAYSNVVTSIDLPSASLAGPFPTAFCRLPFLSFLSLPDNELKSTIPATISNCTNLTYLDLSANYFEGPIPSTLPDIPNMVHLDFQDNSLSGEIPASFGKFRVLRTLNLTNNLLNGSFPVVLTNVTSLTQLVLAYNNFIPGPIPPHLANLSNIQHLWLSSCGFAGTIPDTFSRLNKLSNLELSYNSLTGLFPNVIFQLKNLYQLELYNNSFSGELPKKGWSNLNALRRVDLSVNRFTGAIPVELCKLPLSSLCLSDNNLQGLIPESLAKSPNLYDLRLFDNSLIGPIPSDLGKASPVMTLDLSFNKLFGEIPSSLCEHGELVDLVLIGNSFSGQLPAKFGECKCLQRVRVSNNRLSGEVPVRIWGLPHLYLLDLSENMFSGNISISPGGVNLSSIMLSGNSFSGSIPDQIGSLTNLVKFLASDNKLTGGIPESLLKLNHLGTLDLSGNNLSGKIPLDIERLKELNELNLANNSFTGEIPNQIGNLPVLNYLDLSGNLLYGMIPSGLANLKLNKLNLSNNRLSGEIPSVFYKQVYRESFLGNPGLCGGFGPHCVENKNPSRKDRNPSLWLLRLVFVFAAFVLVIGVIWFVFKFNSVKKMNQGVAMSKWRSFHKLGFSETEIVHLLNESNVIGSGASGKVYKATLSNGESVAVKKLRERNEEDTQKDEFESEVETLGKIRHKNIVRLWCCFNSGNSRLLVYEYMPNGSLGDLLHSTKGRLLEWSMRFKIALDAAEGLSYLHHDCVPPIVHRDVKSNNILLDEDYGARIADFGVAKFIKLANKGSESMSVIAGSRGYIAPEYAYTLRVNEKSDVYSFGIVILELVTGRKPIDPTFSERNLATWVQATVNKKGHDHVLDPELEYESKEQIYKVLDIGLLCIAPLPMNRPSMRTVVNLLQESNVVSKPKPTINKDGKVSPCFEEYCSEEASLV